MCFFAVHRAHKKRRTAIRVKFGCVSLIFNRMHWLQHCRITFNANPVSWSCMLSVKHHHISLVVVLIFSWNILLCVQSLCCKINKYRSWENFSSRMQAPGMSHPFNRFRLPLVSTFHIFPKCRTVLLFVLGWNTDTESIQSRIFVWGEICSLYYDARQWTSPRTHCCHLIQEGERNSKNLSWCESLTLSIGGALEKNQGSIKTLENLLRKRIALRSDLRNYETNY